nr:probable sucrose-phosphate synthase 1 isoform X2 [Ipomoea batatas]GME17827.1 probable sucrose-phosphate synthase 1 isoform X2 [Ipomoea batatas]
MRPISTALGSEHKRHGALKSGIQGWRTCAGGFGIWLARKSSLRESKLRGWLNVVKNVRGVAERQ